MIHALHNVAVLLLKWWTFLCFCRMATSDDQPIKFMIKYGVSTKIVSCQVHEFANIYDIIRRAFQPTILAQGFTVQFLHKDFNDYVDLDSLIQLEDRKNNELICNKNANNMQGNNEKKVCDNYGKDSSESEESESESEHSL